MTLFQAFLQRSGLGLELIPFLYLVTTQVLEEVDASLLEQQGKESNSSHEVPTLRVDELIGKSHGNIAFSVKVVLMST